MAEPLDKASAWTDAEIDWIYDHGGYIYGYTRDAIDNETSREAANTAVLIGDVGGMVSSKIGLEETDNRSVWDKITDWFSTGINKVADVLVDAYNYGRDWVDQRINRIRWGDLELIGDIASTVQAEIDKEAWADALLIGDVGGWVKEEIEETIDRAWWENLSFDFPEFSLDPLAGILDRLIDTIGARLERFIAHALDIKYEGK